MASKANNQRHESTIDKYFEKTAKGFDVWVEGNEDDRSYLQIAAECTGDTDEKGHPATISMCLTQVKPNSSQMDFSKI